MTRIQEKKRYLPLAEILRRIADRLEKDDEHDSYFTFKESLGHFFAGELAELEGDIELSCSFGPGFGLREIIEDAVAKAEER